MIDKFREVTNPLIKAGVIYITSNSSHNNPVMLIPKKTKGQYGLVFDNRLVNAVCRPVGSNPSIAVRNLGATNFHNFRL